MYRLVWCVPIWAVDVCDFFASDPFFLTRIQRERWISRISSLLALPFIVTTHELDDFLNRAGRLPEKVSTENINVIGLAIDRYVRGRCQSSLDRSLMIELITHYVLVCMQWSVLFFPLPATSLLNSNALLLWIRQSMRCLEIVLMFPFWISCRYSASCIWILDLFLLWTPLATLGCSALLCSAGTMTSVWSDADAIPTCFHGRRRCVRRVLLILLAALARFAGLFLLYAGQNRKAFLLVVER